MIFRRILWKLKIMMNGDWNSVTFKLSIAALLNQIVRFYLFIYFLRISCGHLKKHIRAPFTKILLCLKCVKVVPAENKFACAEDENVARQHNTRLVPDPYYSGQDTFSHRTGWSNLCGPDGGFSLTTTSQYHFVWDWKTCNESFFFFFFFFFNGC